MSAPVRVEALGSGSRLFVRVQPGARRPGIRGLWDDHLRVAVAAPPRDGRANEELRALLAPLLGLEVAQLELVVGHSSRSKALAVPLAPEELRRRLAALLEPTR